jgi:hypothetical protein
VAKERDYPSDDASWRPPLEDRINVPMTGDTAYGAGRPYRHGVHKGVDLAARVGSPVHAIAAGKVIAVHADWHPGDGRYGGNNVTIEHAGGLRSQYMHLSTILVHPGDQVGAGELIAKSGDTGGARASDVHAKPMSPHLHFQMQMKLHGTWTTVPPYSYLPHDPPPDHHQGSADAGSSQGGTDAGGSAPVFDPDDANYSSSDGQQLHVDSSGRPDHHTDDWQPDASTPDHHTDDWQPDASTPDHHTDDWQPDASTPDHHTDDGAGYDPGYDAADYDPGYGTDYVAGGVGDGQFGAPPASTPQDLDLHRGAHARNIDMLLAWHWFTTAPYDPSHDGSGVAGGDSATASHNAGHDGSGFDATGADGSGA